MSKRLYRVVLLGDAGTGKTQMVLCLKEEDANCTKRRILEVRPTIGADIVHYERELDRYTTLQVVDTAGGERYGNFCGFMCKGAHFFLLCYAADNKESFDNIVYRWMPFLQDFSEHSTIILVETKTDIQERRVEEGEAKALADVLGVQLYHTTSTNPSTVHALMYKVFDIIDEGGAGEPRTPNDNNLARRGRCAC